MAQQDELTGSTVMVNPELIADPADKIGQIGTIEAADIAQDNFQVRFEDNQVGVYSADALLVLQKPEKIFSYLEQHAPQLNWSDYKDIFNMALLQKHGYPEQIPTVFEIAQKSALARSIGTISLENSLDLKTVQSRGR
ncbi:hypothetical protein [Mucilaginibacter lappiensis]|uniref:hypothetical protein n=1 Tax=Mucilaginibacter lappiensis TaxID=354630 RepID=UPI003D1ACEAD